MYQYECIEELKNLEEIHDKIKEHQYRIKPTKTNIKSYKKLMLDLIDSICRIAYNSNYSQKDRFEKCVKLWTHDWNANLEYYYGGTPIHSNWIPFYEGNLGIIHSFIKTQEPPEFCYIIVKCWKDETKKGNSKENF